ncbi:hypothetical protein P6O24_15185, partial [Clostridium perfringens]|nr:hypothetical protein [Clostridium perfringens]
IKRANALKSRTQFCNSQDATAADACSKQDARAEQELNEYRNLMDVMLKLTAVYRQKANWGWNPFDP